MLIITIMCIILSKIIILRIFLIQIQLADAICMDRLVNKSEDDETYNNERSTLYFSWNKIV